MNRQFCALVTSLIMTVSTGSASEGEKGPKAACASQFPAIRGSGILGKTTYSKPDLFFSKIRASGPGELHIIGGATNELTIQTDINICRKPCFSVKEGELEIELEMKHNVQLTFPIVYTLQLCPATLKLLTHITTNIHTWIKTPIETQNLTICTQGHGEFTAEEELKIKEELSLQHGSSNLLAIAYMTARQLTLNHSGSGNLILKKGRATCALINTNNLTYAPDLIINDLTLYTSGRGSFSCTLQNSASGSLIGTGEFINYGPGNVTKLAISPSTKYIDEYVAH